MKYTIEDLRNGKVAVINDGTLEDLRAVLKLAFPESDGITDGAFKAYCKNEHDFEMWWSYHGSHLPTQSVKDFFKCELKTTDTDHRVFETGSKRDSDVGKPRVADLKAYTRLRFGYHMLIGSEKYGEGNFELGQPDESTLKSLHRHLAMYENGDRSECHLSAILFGIQMIMLNEQREGVAIDHYYRKYKNS